MYTKNFDKFMDELKTSIVDLEYYTDFDKVINNNKKVRNKLDILNTILGTQDSKKRLYDLLENNPDLKAVLPIFIAKREKNILTEKKQYNFLNISDMDAQEFVNDTGLIKLIEQKLLTNFNDFQLGIEVGLDTNARKNRTGTQMVKKVIDYLNEENINYKIEVNSKLLENLYNIPKSEIDLIFKEKDAKKVFDFAFERKGILYLGEINAYTAGGSKLNEVCKSYIYLNQKINCSSKMRFIWFTDGIGWRTAKNQIREAYEEIENLFNLSDLENHLIEGLLK
ncbi:DpnII family type II restriction endonuclease [Mesoplasma syrphidae]|nr:DpnII family type II restriction endonuclease [Mesoplasma syrphidae]